MIDYVECEMPGCREQKHLDFCAVCDQFICPAHRSIVAGEIACHACAPQKPAAPAQGEMFSQGGRTR